MAATLAVGTTRSQPSLTWEQLSRMGTGIDFPRIRGGQTIHARLERRPRRYVIADGSPQVLYFYRATNCSRGEERTNAAWINCGPELGPEVYIPVLFVTPASKPRSGKPPPTDLVLTQGGTNSLEHYVPPSNPRSSGNTKVVWVRLDNPLGGVKSSLDAPAVSAALVLCMPLASSECQTAGLLANLADDPGTATPPAAPAEDPSPTEVAPRPPVNPTVPAAPPVNPLPRGPGLAHPQVNPPASPLPAAGLTPGRWLLGLYGPQNVGVGVDASAGAIADAQDQILDSLTRFLDDFHGQNFKSPAIDLILMTRSGASSDFPEKNVITGTTRRPRSDKLQLDHEGHRRLAAFLAGPGSAGAEASFKSVGDMIRSYGQGAGESAGQRPPIAIYVGAARPRPDSCLEWKKMTADIAAGLSSRPRVFGIVFADASAGEVDEQLGRNERGDNEAIAAARTRVATCNGEGGSVLLFVSFPDLISHKPESVLAQVFGAVRRRAEKAQN
jgi:hypothetical protein